MLLQRATIQSKLTRLWHSIHYKCFINHSKRIASINSGSSGVGRRCGWTSILTFVEFHHFGRHMSLSFGCSFEASSLVCDYFDEYGFDASDLQIPIIHVVSSQGLQGVGDVESMWQGITLLITIIIKSHFSMAHTKQTTRKSIGRLWGSSWLQRRWGNRLRPLKVSNWGNLEVPEEHWSVDPKACKRDCVGF